jgi:hypothetical protein
VGSREWRTAVVLNPDPEHASLILIYTTTDEAFASSAVSALKAAHIDSFMTGAGSDRAIVARGERAYCIHVTSDADSARANQILIELGAVPDRPLRLPTGRWVAFVLFAVGVGVLQSFCYRLRC